MLRDAVDRDDFSHGCGICGTEHTLGSRELSHAVQYDRFTAPELPPWPQRIEFALSNTCNLQCIMCSGELSSAIRSQREHRPPMEKRYGDRFMAELRAVLPHLEVATFMGGEPFLTRETRQVWDLLIELDLRPEVHVTTNGTVWNDRVERYLLKLEMNVSLSIDAVTPATMAAVRVGADLDEVRIHRDRILETVRSYGGTFTLNHCVMPQNWQEFGAFLLEADEIDVPVYIARVLDPAHVSLYHLPPTELAQVITALEREGEALRPLLGRNRPVWDEELADLRRHHEGGQPDRHRGIRVQIRTRLDRLGRR